MDARRVENKNEVWIALKDEEAKLICDYLQETFSLTEIGGQMRIAAARLVSTIINAK